MRRLEQLKPVFEVLRLMAPGLNNKETVHFHVPSILSKLGVRDRARAVLRSLELGYI